MNESLQLTEYANYYSKPMDPVKASRDLSHMGPETEIERFLKPTGKPHSHGIDDSPACACHITQKELK